MEEVAGAQDTIYLCNFRVSVDGEWLCLKELQDLDIQESGGSNTQNEEAGTVANFGIPNNKSDEKLDRDWVNYCRWLRLIRFGSFVFNSIFLFHPDENHLFFFIEIFKFFFYGFVFDFL